MDLGGIKLAERQRDEASVKLLGKLREKLVRGDISKARQAASNLSWKQEDGLEILAGVLLGNYPRTAKKAAAYGLRKMNGRMRKMASEVLKQGLKHHNRTTQAACVKSIALMKGRASGNQRSPGRGQKSFVAKERDTQRRKNHGKRRY